MPFSLTDLLYGIVVPALLAAMAMAVLHRFGPGEIFKRSAAAVALVAGFLAGYGLLGLGPWKPAAHWHWLPWAVLLSVAATPVIALRGRSWLPRLLRYSAVVTIVAMAAWLLVPTWPDLAPPRGVLIVAWTTCVVLLALLLEPLAERLPGPTLPLVLTASLLAAAIVLALAGSLRFAQLAGLGMAAMSGMTLVAATDRAAHRLGGVSLGYALLIGGALLVGQVNSFSSVPGISYVLVAGAPLLIWIGVLLPSASTSGTAASRGGWKRGLVLAGPPLVVLAVAILLAALAELV